MSSVKTCTQVQLDAAMDAIWGDLEAKYNTIEDVKARLVRELWPEPVEMPASVYNVLTVHAGDSGAPPSAAPKRGRKSGPMTEEAKQRMLAMRRATLAAKKAQVPEVPAPAPEAKPLKIKVPKAKMAKEERSAAAKARYAALSEEGKAAIRERLVAARAKGKAAKAAV